MLHAFYSHASLLAGEIRYGHTTTPVLARFAVYGGHSRYDLEGLSRDMDLVFLGLLAKANAQLVATFLSTIAASSTLVREFYVSGRAFGKESAKTPPNKIRAILPLCSAFSRTVQTRLVPDFTAA